MEKSREKCNMSFSKIKKGYNEIFIEHIEFLNEYVNQRLHYYFDDLEKQLSQLNTQDSTQQIHFFKQTLEKTVALQEKLIKFDL